MKKTALVLAAILTLSNIAPNLSYADEKPVDKLFNALSTLTTMVSVTPFKDTANHWGKTYINKLQREGYTVGSNGKFNPEQTLRTEDFIIMVLKVLSPEAKELKAAQGEIYYKPFIDKANALGLLKGEQDELSFYIEKNMPRELAVQVVDRALTLMGDTTEANKALSYKFKDYSIINDINKEPVLKAYQLGIIKGSKGKFAPKGLLTRAEGAVLIAKLMDKSLREPITIVKNPKTYDTISQWFISEYEKGLPSRPVVVETKTNGIVNKGDVDFTEKSFLLNAKTIAWWSDQEFEDRTLTNLHLAEGHMYSSSLMVNGTEDEKRILDSQGTFFPHNGELAFTLYEDIKDGKARRSYDNPIPNMNRIAYDLAKYGSQYAQATGKYAMIRSDKDAITFTIGETFLPNASTLNIQFYSFPESERSKTDNKFTPDLSIRVSDFNLRDYGPAIQQVFIRLYGEKDGLSVLKKVKALVKGKDGPTVGRGYYEVNGIKMAYHDAVYSNPIIELTLKK